MFGMKQLSTCGKQQQMTPKHFCLEAVVHMWQTTANDIPACWTWNSYPYVANNSKWHTIIFDMKHLSICDKQQQMTYKHFRHETVTIGGKQQQMKHKDLWHETVVHMWQTTANDIQSFLAWNICPYVTNNSKWHTIIFDMKQLSICGKQQQMTHKHLWHETVVHMWQTTANDTQTCLPWNSYPSVANNSKWHRSIFDMKQLSICSKQQQMTHKHVWHETAIHMWQTTANDTRAFLTWKSYPYVATTAKDIQSCLTWNSYVANNSHEFLTWNAYPCFIYLFI